MHVWRRLTGRKSLISNSFRKNERPSEAGELKNKDGGKLEELSKWQPKLLSGEKIINRTSKIIRVNPFSCSEEDEVGELLVTNFRIIFHPDAEQGSDGYETPQRNKLIGNRDIALYNIDTVYSVKKKRKKQMVNGMIPRHLKAFEIHCKDFRTHVFQLKLLPEKHEAILIISAILSGAFPAQMHSLFAFQYGGDTDGEDSPRFNSEHDWKELLERKNASGLFRVAQCNKDFHASDSLPEFFAVPYFLQESEVYNNIKMFSNNRCPVWSYTHPNGASLIRMACAIPGVGEELENRMIEHVKQSHPLGKKEREATVVVFDLSKRLPLLTDIQSSFDALRQLCMPGSVKEFWLSDMTWNSSIESCHWLAYVSSCLSVADEVTANILQSNTVILKEIEAVDFVPLTSCLSQLILDREFRTIEGFQRLVEREWVALGHKFSERYGNCREVKGCARAPVFLLFLDCVWQMVRQFPSHFQFTEYFLISLWDSLCLGLFRNFLFDNKRSSHFVPSKLPSQEIYIRQLNPLALLSVWDWEKHLSDDQIALFYSPQYILSNESSVSDQIPHTSATRRSRSSVSPQRKKKLEPKDGILVPICEVPHMEFWSLCYLRWLPPAEIISGGPASEYLSQCILVEEVLYLRQLISSFESAAAESRKSASRRRSNLIFGSDSNRSLIQSPLSLCVSSSFPYAVDRPVDARFGPGSFIDSYFKNSVLYDEYSATDELDD